MKRFLLFLFTILTLLLAVYLVQQKLVREIKAQGNTYYVATNGNDSNPGTMEDSILILRMGKPIT